MASSDTLMVSISGIRGIVGKTFNARTVEKYISAFATLLKGHRDSPLVVVGRDSRISGPWITSVAEGVLASLGCTVFQCGIVSTPTVQLLVQQHKADGGLIITSSHNPVEWNGLKFVDGDGLFLSPSKCAQLFDIADKSAQIFPSNDNLGRVLPEPEANKKHLDTILSLPFIDAEMIQRKKFKVVLDTIHGAGGPIMEELLVRLGCEVVGLNLEPTGKFHRNPEPLPEHLGELCAKVKEVGADLGIATDPDVDRCVLIDEKGNPLGEEYTLAIAVKLVLGVVGKRGKVCKNLSSSRVVDDIAREYGCEVINTPVGEIHVAKMMEEVKAVIGGEGNGGVMLPDVHIGRDAPVAATLALQLLTKFEGSLSALKLSLPQYEIAKMKAPVPAKFDAGLEELKKMYHGKGTISEVDGMRIDTKEGWVHIRKSNTEPVYRVIGEFGSSLKESTEKCQDLINKFANICNNL